MGRAALSERWPALARLREIAPRAGTLVLLGLAPLLVILGEVFFFHVLHHWLYFGPTDIGHWVLLLALPPLALEVLFTRHYEVRRYGWRIWVILGLVGRIVFLLFCYYLLVYDPATHRNQPDIVHPIIGTWPLAMRLFWLASPYLGALLAVVLVACYALSCRLRVGRLTAVVVLPTLATYLLFYVFYFHPTSWWRFSNGQRPDYVEHVWPTKGSAAVPRGMPRPFFPRAIYVHPDDHFVAVTSGATFGSDINQKPNFLWFDLRTRASKYLTQDTIRRFSSECPETLYFGAWHGPIFYGFDVASRRFHRHAVPKLVDGFRVVEFMHVLHACDQHRVYLANNNNPIIFVWDTAKQKLAKTIKLAHLPKGKYGDSIAMILRNPKLRRLYVLKLGHYPLIEIDERTLTVRRQKRLPYYGIDMAVSPDGSTLYVFGFMRGYVLKLDARTLEVQARFSAPVHGRRLLVSADGRRLYLASYLHGTLQVLDAETGRERLKIFVTPKIEGLYQTRRYLYLYGAEGVFRIPLGELAKRTRK